MDLTPPKSSLKVNNILLIAAVAVATIALVTVINNKRAEQGKKPLFSK